MKKILLLAVPLGLAAILLTAYAAQSFGFRHHHGMMKDFVFYKIDRLSQELNLDPAQQAKMDTFKRDLESMFEDRMGKRKEVHEVVVAELKKENPDIRQLTVLIHQQIDDRAQLAHDITNRLAEFYQDLTPEQKRVLSEKIEQMHDHRWED